MFCIRKTCEKYLWISNILSEDASHWPTSLLEISMYHKYFHIVLVQINWFFREWSIDCRKINKSQFSL